MRPSQKKHQRRARLHKENPFCYYCNELTILLSQEVYNECGEFPSNAATIEHLFDKFDNRRGAVPNHTQQKLWTIACNACNQKRNKMRCIENKELQIAKSRMGNILKGSGTRNMLRIFADIDYFDRF